MSHVQHEDRPHKIQTGHFIEHNIGDTVYLITDDDQIPRLVTAIILRPGITLYTLALIDRESTHYPFEISDKRKLF